MGEIDAIYEDGVLRIVNPARIDSDVVTVGKDTEPGRYADRGGHERYFGRS